MDPNLWRLCQRDAMLSLRDQARREARAGSLQAAHVVDWIERALATCSLDASNSATASLSHVPARPGLLRSPHRAAWPTQTR